MIASGREHGRARARERHLSGVLLRFLGSMNLAIILLVAAALASVIGTILQQNQPYQDYLVKFGPFWFEVFRALGLYDVYTAGWFLLILAALITSTSVCLTRHGPVVLREMRSFRTNQQVRSLRATRSSVEWHAPVTVHTAAERTEGLLRRQGYRVRRKGHGGAVLLAGLAGKTNRLGYIAAHLAIVVICIGGVMDSNLGLKLRAWTGALVPETRHEPLAEIAPASRLPVGGSAFRGSVTIPEGDHASAVRLQLGDGYVVRELPFEIRLDAFRIERYAGGQPRAYESDVSLHGPGLDEPVRRTLRVNEPLHHDGYVIYQSSVSDGGSALSLVAWPLAGDDRSTERLDTRVFERETFERHDRQYRLEFTHFEPNNPRPDGSRIGNQPGSRDIGPSFRYHIRKPTGETLEFENSMRPLEIDGGHYFLSGMRRSASEDFRYLHIPADQQESPARFVALAAILAGDDAEGAAQRAAREVMTGAGIAGSDLARQLEATALALLERLRAGGYRAVERHLQETPDNVHGLESLPRQLLDHTLAAAYRQALGETGDDPERRLTRADAEFLEHTVATLPALPRYGAPVFLQLEAFELRQASGLEVTRSPGKPVVYVGFLLLVTGIVLMFYVRFRRAWCWLEPDPRGGTRVLLAGQAPRDPVGFEGQFRDLQEMLRRRLAGDRTGRA